ncbi:hypothetical protein STANM309S_05484 [Streptomyces tanashiensis]
MPGTGEDDPALRGLGVREERGRRAGGLGEPEQELQVGEDGDGVLALHHRVRPEGGAQPAHGGERARAGAGDGADGQAQGAVGQRQRVVPVAAAQGAGAVAGGELDAGDAGEAAGEQLLGDGGDLDAGALDLEEPGEVLGGEAAVEPDEVALAVGGFGGLVVEPDDRAEPAGLLGGEGEGVAGGVAEAGGDLAVARVESLLGTDVADGDRVGDALRVHGIGEAVEEAAVAGGAARDGLDGAQVGVGEAEADGAGRAVAVGRFEDGHAAAGADEGGAGAEHLAEGLVEGGGPDEALGEFVEGGEVGDPGGQPVLDHGTGWEGRVGRSRRRGHPGEGRRSVRGPGNRGIDSGHFRHVWGAHVSRLSDRCV